MPALYAHNQFGNKVLRKLDEENRKRALRYLPLFRIGLQGPDYLFFYHPFQKNEISGTGYRLHEESALGFIEHAQKIIEEKGMDSPEYAYALGFICHFALDSECHPFVESEILRTGVGHIEIESEFEKHLMRKNGEEPLSYPIGKTFPTDPKTAGIVAEFYEGITPKYACRSLRSMRFCKNVLTAPCPVKRALIDIGMRISGQYESLQGHLLRPKDNPKCSESIVGLEKRLEGAVPVALGLIRDFESSVEVGTELSDRFDRNFE
ncbi:MAG: zinc dependent phospholipase C family protein [Lachnospiraceae bacterium]|nr:zinc dependent phospholipase C family protein [Lachnospiraceae bacterium]